MYSLSNSDGGRQFPLAPNVENVQLESCEFVSGDNWEAIDFNYSTENGERKLKDRIFAVKKENCNPRVYIENDTREAAFEANVKALNTKLKHIATKFIVGDISHISGRDFKEYAINLCKEINTVSRGVRLYCKTVKNPAGYIKMASKVPFLQRMDTGECELKYTPKELESAVSVKSGVEESGDRGVVQDNWA